eukprot:g71821.t1
MTLVMSYYQTNRKSGQRGKGLWSRDEPDDDVAEYEIGVGTSFDASPSPLALARKLDETLRKKPWVTTTTSTTTTTTTTTTKRVDANIMAARKMHDGTTSHQYTQDSWMLLSKTSQLSLRDDDARGTSLDAVAALLLWLCTDPHKRGGDGTTTWLGQDKLFPPTFLRNPKSLPWYNT